MNIVNSLLEVNFTPGREGHSIRNIILRTMSGPVSGRGSYFRNGDVAVATDMPFGSFFFSLQDGNFHKNPSFTPLPECVHERT